MRATDPNRDNRTDISAIPKGWKAIDVGIQSPSKHTIPSLLRYIWGCDIWFTFGYVTIPFCKTILAINILFLIFLYLTIK